MIILVIVIIIIIISGLLYIHVYSANMSGGILEVCVNRSSNCVNTTLYMLWNVVIIIPTSFILNYVILVALGVVTHTYI